MPEAGKVATGFSKPYVGKYTNNGGTVTYTSGKRLARGVSVSIDPETADENVFHADDVAAESAAGTFTGGTVTLTVDGLLMETEQLVMGLPEPAEVSYGEGKTVNAVEYGDNIDIPYLGIGFITRYQSGGVVTYAPTLLTKTRFQTPGTEAATQEDEIDWQTQELTATLMRDDTPNHVWKRIFEDQATEAAAEEILKSILGVTAG